MFTGTVVHGEAVGRTLGFPTANLDVPVQKITLHDGVYASRVSLGDRTYNGALAIKKSERRVEVFLLDYEGPEFYDTEISIDPLAIVSEYEHYDSLEELKEKIARDVELVRLACKDIGF
jgi:riboflavin kinase/FMN adenylyltransferase